jgi:D-glycero-D-manno-heptose 1,7-bisphosphate phosphatase
MSEKAIFLDRDDTLIEDPGYISSPEQVKLLDGVPEALIELKSLGYKLIVVTNQSAVARGIVTEKVLGEIHNRLKQLLAEKNAFLDRIYYCPYHPEGAVAKYRKESDSRKPNAGMLLKAAKEMDIDLGQSWCIGNSVHDVEAGLRAGCKTILIDLPSHQKQLEPGQPGPDYRAVNIKEVVNIIKKYHRTPETTATTAQPPSTNQTKQASQVIEPVPKVVEPMSQVVEPVSRIEEQQPQPKPEKLQTQLPEQETTGETTKQLLTSIHKELKSMQRTEMFGEFSIMRLMAGIVQILVLFCLLITIWFLMSPNRQDNSVFIALGFAMVLQLMSLTFYIMHGRK